MQSKKVYVEGIEPKNDNSSLKAAIKDVFLKSTNNLEWLMKGDIVLLKPALNSDNPYPSTTHPFAISVISKILAEEGANVLVGDQSGLGHVVQDDIGVIRGNTHDNFIKSGMGKDEDNNFISFESRGWNKGFIHHQSDYTTSWPDGFYVTKCIEKADHIINLPRLSTHSQAGVTFGFKNMVGILRDDSRMDFHANGPFNNFIKREAKGSTLKSVDDGSGTFIEKIVEINDAIKEKLRVTLFVATKAQATFGPNQSEFKLGKLEIAKANIVNLNPEMVFASADPVAVESFAFALIKGIRNDLPPLSKFISNLILSSNKNINHIDKIPIRKQTFIQHAIDIGLGNMPDQIVYNNIPIPLQKRLGKYLEET
ncbi:DUF362 domain-containing protein [Methanobacterium sp.]|uniref:DUF362 domain-containing protein n=1 Tax=Methanobacterium sp. TaxID=2164 RepID=UPI003C77531C